MLGGAAEWPIYAVVLASASIVIGLIWDVSWHKTIGRDTFWSPPHLLEQIAAVVVGLSCGYLVLSTTFAGDSTTRGRSVRYWRFFQAPLGAWVCIWGTMMMVTSAPLDNWWHDAYGLDIKLLSPPHMVLALGMISIELGAMLMALGAQNRAVNDSEPRLGIIFVFSASILVLMMAVVLLTGDASFANDMHGSTFYQVTGVVLPWFLIAFARAARLSWPATRIAIGYMLITLASIWILQLMPAEAKVAPIHNVVTHMVPPAFPLLLFAPALAVDLLMRRFGEDSDWKLSVALGFAFVAVMLGVHWFWADFMLSPKARNFFFGADQWDYKTRLGPWRYEFWNLDTDATGRFSAGRFLAGMGAAVALAVVSSRIGLWWGAGMSRVKR